MAGGLGAANYLPVNHARDTRQVICGFVWMHAENHCIYLPDATELSIFVELTKFL